MCVELVPSRRPGTCTKGCITKIQRPWFSLQFCSSGGLITCRYMQSFIKPTRNGTRNPKWYFWQSARDLNALQMNLSFVLEKLQELVATLKVLKSMQWLFYGTNMSPLFPCFYTSSTHPPSHYPPVGLHIHLDQSVDSQLGEIGASEGLLNVHIEQPHAVQCCHWSCCFGDLMVQGECGANAAEHKDPNLAIKSDFFLLWFLFSLISGIKNLLLPRDWWWCHSSKAAKELQHDHFEQLQWLWMVHLCEDPSDNSAAAVRESPSCQNGLPTTGLAV